MFRDGTGAPLSWPIVSHVGTAAVPVASHVGMAAVGTAAVPVGSHAGTGAVGTGAVGTAAVAGAGDEAATVLALMGGRGGWSLDALVDASGLHVGAVQGALLGLELDGHVSCDSLGGYAPCTTLEPYPL